MSFTGIMGAKTQHAVEIARRSTEIARKIIPGDGLAEEITRRCIIATGDVSVKDILVFKGEPESGVEAIKMGSKIIVDVNMVKAGLRREAISAIDFGENVVETRVAAGLKKLKKMVEGSIIGIGNAPSAAIALCEIAKEYPPSFIVATPVGFVNAAESKEMIRRLDIPSITTVGTRGGSTICTAIINCLIEYAERSS
jgi:precorrin isomerase